MKLTAFAFASSLALASAFVPSTGVNRLSVQNNALRPTFRSDLKMAAPSKFPPPPEVFEAASDAANSLTPQLTKYGFGSTPKAERWNGRHAMFGWFAIILTGYAKSHNLIPNGDEVLTLDQWGGLAQIGGGATITNERAIIMIAHIHVLFVSFIAAAAPFSFSDSLIARPGEESEPLPGFLPSNIKGGLSASAELLNGRMAMLGLTALVVTSVATGTPILEVVDQGIGGLLLTNPMF
jgi:hypothetical protein